MSRVRFCVGIERPMPIARARMSENRIDLVVFFILIGLNCGHWN